MSVETVLTFMNELAERDPEVLRGLLESGPEAVVAAAQERGVTLALDDVIKGGTIIGEAIQLSAENGELTEEALDTVAGGLLITTLGITAATMALTIGTAAGIGGSALIAAGLMRAQGRW